MRSKLVLIGIICILLLPGAALPALIDRVVAFVDNEAILLSELNESYEKTKPLAPGITNAEVLETLINRRLLLIEAKKLFPELADEERMIKEYIDLKVRAFIIVPEDELRAFYEQNRKEFEGLEFEDVRDQIELLLVEKEVNRKLQTHIESLRANAYIKSFIEAPTTP